MRARWLLLLLIGLGLALSACGPSAPTATALPASLVPAPHSAASEAAAHVLRVRIYAGADYRERLLDWRADAERVLASASGLLTACCKAELHLVETIEWKRSGGDLDKTLTTLRLLDPGADVDLIVGLIDAPAAHSDVFAELAAYDLLGKHLVVRSYARQVERDALPALSSLREAEQDRVLAARAQHKQSSLLASAIAHLFGADDASEDFVDAAAYNPQQAELSPGAGARLQLVIPAHLAKGTKAWSSVLKELKADSARPALLARVEERLTEGKGPVRDASSGSSIRRDVDRERLQQARNLIASRKGEEAWARLEVLLELYPDAPELLLPACQSAQLREASDAVGYCQRATEAHPELASAWIALARTQTKGSPADQRKSLDRAASLLAKQVSPNRDDWSTLARAYQKLSLPRAAERAAVKGGPESVLTWVHEMQARYGTSVGVAEDREAAYLDAVTTGLKYVYASDMKRAAASADALAKSFPSSIASSLIRCEIALRQRDYKAAAEACRQVLKRHPENSWAHYLLGLMHGRQSDNTAAIEELQRAIASDSTLKAAYQTLATIYTTTKDGRLPDLRARYKERFHSELN